MTSSFDHDHLAVCLLDRADALTVNSDLEQVLVAADAGGVSVGGTKGPLAPSIRFGMAAAIALLMLGVGLLVESRSDGPTTAAASPEFCEVVVWMEPEADPEHVDAVGDLLTTWFEPSDFHYRDKEASYEAFTSHYADMPEILELVGPKDVPTSYLMTARLTMVQERELGAMRSVASVQTENAEEVC